MMFWKQLDKTPWARFVLELYYVMADEELDRLLKSGGEPAASESLDSHVPYPESDVESTVDNPKADPDY
ncbi:hypothetical protein V7S43_018958 [Phytophthora oleae]|uniref:Uncharacterized protein n=1 Tax=Phytophthora oleae TaxID=2107226 RepID=A0ABD3EPU2_9STRA